MSEEVPLAPPQSGSETHYVIVVHGTWNPPKPGRKHWYQLYPDDPTNFCHRLNQRFAGGPLERAVWRQCPSEAEGTVKVEFHWSGGNDHDERLEAAKKLCDLIDGIRNADPTCRLHFVAHSHGGNVLLEALACHGRRLKRDYWEIGHYLMRRAGVASVRTRLTRRGRTLTASQKQLLTELVPPDSKDPFLSVHARWRVALDWTYERNVHRIGRIVFLGTPFYYKSFRPRGLAKQVLHALSEAVSSLLFSMPFVYVVVLLSSGMVALLSPMDFIGFSPGDWPLWVQIVSAPVPLFYFLILVVQESFTEGRDLNLYFGPSEKMSGEGSPLEALAVSAGMLDEALLALSAEPLFFALLAPAIERYTAPTVWKKVPKLATGVTPRLRHRVQHFFQSIVVFLRNVLTYPFNKVRQRVPRLRLWPRFLTKKVLAVISATGFGLDGREFDSARIRAQPQLISVGSKLKAFFWDVERTVAARQPQEPVVAEAADYSYLWDADQLRERLEDSLTWSKLSQNANAIQSRFPGNQVEEQFLQRLCVTIDERMRQFGGAVELLHSTYYGSDEIIDAIAAFIADGSIPEGAHEVT